MNYRWASVLSIVVVAPLAVDVNAPDRDSTATRLMLAAGAGSYAYVTRGCEGGVLGSTQYRYRDAGAALDHRFHGPVEAGVRATVLRRMPQYGKNTLLVNPNASLEGNHVGFGLGAMLGDRRPRYDARGMDVSPVTGHLRFGTLRGPYFSLHVYEDVPVVSGGSPVRLGMGFRTAPLLDTWIGLGTPVPYDKPGVVAKTDIHLWRHLDVNLSGRLGSSEGLAENGGAVGITLRRSRVTP